MLTCFHRRHELYQRETRKHWMQTHAPALAQSQPDSEVTLDPGHDSLRQNYELLLIAWLLALVGGYLDAYAYLAHGKVFANAQTGNVVFLAVYDRMLSGRRPPGTCHPS